MAQANSYDNKRRSWSYNVLDRNGIPIVKKGFFFVNARLEMINFILSKKNYLSN
jgi:hypothetical protein